MSEYSYGSLIFGVPSKFSSGGGEDVIHSRDEPPHGFPGDFGPRNSEYRRFAIMITKPIATMYAPRVAN